MKINSLVFAAALALPMIASADSPKKPAPTESKVKLSEGEVKIIAHLHHVNEMEITLGKEAKAKGTEPVKRYGEMMIKDHTAADKELTAMAKQKGISKIPADTPTTDADKAEMKSMTESMASMKKLKGADFDREYLRMMVDGHEKELAKSDGYIAMTQDPELKAALEARKGMLTRHADEAKQLQKGNAQATTKPETPPKPTK